MRETPPAPQVPVWERRVLSLCDHTGNWSKPYLDAGYNVTRVDLLDGVDVRLMELPAGTWHGILAAPPCTKFCRLGNTKNRTPEEWREALSVVDACLRFVAILKPTWWALENPPGQLTRWLGPHQFSFHPAEFGDAYSKLTYLWGNFRAPSHRITPWIKAAGIETWEKDRTRRTDDPVQRSATPQGFARAFFEANP